ncbi:MAG: hypothetical protein EXS08_03545 [Planctomycetes bacterium]|nr:hypothetical protein [Planctomycetota bacterium]
MVSKPSKRRFVVSDLGFTFAVHDTQAKQDYAFQAGKDKAHKSSNALNTKRVELYPTREEAVRAALELNEKHESGTLGW